MIINCSGICRFTVQFILLLTPEVGAPLNFVPCAEDDAHFRRAPLRRYFEDWRQFAAGFSSAPAVQRLLCPPLNMFDHL